MDMEIAANTTVVTTYNARIKEHCSECGRPIQIGAAVRSEMTKRANGDIVVKRFHGASQTTANGCGGTTTVDPSALLNTLTATVN